MPWLPVRRLAAMLLIYTKTLAVTSYQEFDEAFYKPLPSGYTYGYLQTNQSEKFYQRESLLECAGIALNSQSEFFTYDNVTHLCKNYSPKNIMTVVRTNNTNKIAFYKHSQWIRIYAISKGADSLVYDSFMNIGNSSSWNVDKCNATFCPNFFRHPILDFWNFLPIDEVKLVIHKNQTDVVTITFNGRNTTLESWFSLTNLKSSPWDDLPSPKRDDLSLVGNGIKRRFHIGNHNGDCIDHYGWLFVAEKRLYCPFDNIGYYPAILYSDRKSKVIWNNGYALADSMAIFIHLTEEN